MNQTEGKVYPLETTAKMQSLMSNYNRELREAVSKGKKVGWATGQAPADILLAMDIIPAYPENHAATCGASHVGTQLCQVAEEHGYSPDTCSYSRNSLGSCFVDDSFKVPPLPKPDIVFAPTLCTTHVKWWEALGRYYNIPVLILETPFIHDGLDKEDIKRAIKYVENQLKEMAKFLAEFCGRPYDYDRLQESVSNSAKAAQQYGRFVNMARHKPSPITVFDAFINLAPMMTLRGLPESISYYEALANEVEGRAKQGFSAVGKESYRLYWDNLPVWYKVGWLARKLAGYGACAVTASYSWSWIATFAGLDSEHPIESIAESQCLFFVNQGAKYRINFVSKLVQDFSADGLLASVTVTCKAFNPDQMAILREVQKVTGKPVAMIEGDLVDERYFNETQVSQQIEDFIAVLARSTKNR